MRKVFKKSKKPESKFKDQRDKHKAEYTELGWRLIEHKLMYYYPELIDEDYHKGLTIPDDEYDDLEIRYLTLCKKFGFNNTVVHKGYTGFEDVKGDGMMEVDLKRPIVHLILRKWGVKGWQKLI